MKQQETTNLRDYENLEKRTNQANQKHQTWMDRINRIKPQATTKAGKPQKAQKAQKSDGETGITDLSMIGAAALLRRSSRGAIMAILKWLHMPITDTESARIRFSQDKSPVVFEKKPCILVIFVVYFGCLDVLLALANRL